MKIKSIIFCSLILIILAFNNIRISASEKEYKKLSDITEMELANAALNFSREFTDKELNISDIIPIYDYGMKLIGYSVSFNYLDEPYGYVNFDFTYDDFVNDFSIEEGVLNPYYNLYGLVKSRYSVSYAEKYLIRCNYLEYCIVFYDQNEASYYFCLEDGLIEENSFRIKAEALKKEYKWSNTSETVYNSSSDIFTNYYISGSTVIEGPTLLSKYNSSLSALSQNYITGLTGRYACAVVALTEIAGQEGILVTGFSNLNDRIFYTFDALWSYTNTFIIKIENSISYGSTYDSQIASGLYTHCLDMGKNNTYFNTSSSPSYAFYKTAISNNASSTMSYRIYVYDGSNVVSRGHTVNVVGYCQALYSNTVSNYLIVADGWNGGSVKYINITNIDFIDKYGVRFYIS